MTRGDHVIRWRRPRRRAVLLAALAFALTLAGFFALRGLGFWSDVEPGRVRPVPPGDQEIAWIAPATSGDTWERLVKALRLLTRTWPEAHDGALEIDTTRAFLPLTADVPEVGLRFPGSSTLWVRWYKISGANDLVHWVHVLQQRVTPPLALAGGETSDRALALAQILVERESSWNGDPPVFLITTATAERFLPAGKPELQFQHENWPRLLGVYPGRSFRFAFTNTRMVEAVLEFVREHPEAWPRHDPNKVGKSDAAKHPPFFLFTLTWLDDGYSRDLASAFQQQYADFIWKKFGKGDPLPSDEDFVHYSVGDYYQPNPREEMAVGLFLANNARRADQPQLLVLPTGTARARRFLRTLCRRAPKEARNLVVVNGDAISFNNIFRDRDVAWNIQDVPVPLVFFSHRSPIDPAAGFLQKEPGQSWVTQTSTQDLLLLRDLFEATVLASFQDGVLLDRAELVLTRLRDTTWRDDHVGNRSEKNTRNEGMAFFDAEGNRRAGTGEHVVWLRPIFEGERVLPEASITVWRVRDGKWTPVGEPLQTLYDR